MARRTRISRPPQTDNQELNRWLGDVHAAINDLPNFSIESTTAGPNSNFTADEGVVFIDVGSAVTTSWIKQTGSGNTGWVELDNFTRWQDEVAYGGLWTDEDAAELTVGTSAITLNAFFHEQANHNLSSSTTQGIITIESTGTYLCTFHSAFTGSASVQFNFYVYKNGIDTHHGTHKVATAQGAASCSITPSVCTADAGDIFSINFYADGANKKLTNIDAQFTTWKIQ